MSIASNWIFQQTLPLLLVLAIAAPRACPAQDAKKANPPSAAAEQEKGQAEKAPADEPNPPADAEKLEFPAPVPQQKLLQTLQTIPVRRDNPAYNYRMINTQLLPRDKEGIWVLDFSFKPLRIRTVEIPGKGRQQVIYLYYKVANRTGQPRMFVPQFIMVNEQGEKFEDQVIPQAIRPIQTREDPTIPVLGAVNIMGILPPSTKQGVDDAVYGVATWSRWDPRSDRFSIYVRGLSDGYKELPAAKGGKPAVKYKTLKIDFIRRGDEHNISEKEIELSDPAYEWVYW